jgi:hypothetical protein
MSRMWAGLGSEGERKRSITIRTNRREDDAIEPITPEKRGRSAAGQRCGSARRGRHNGLLTEGQETVNIAEKIIRHQKYNNPSPGAANWSSSQQTTHCDYIHVRCHGSLHLPVLCVRGKSDAAVSVVVVL